MRIPETYKNMKLVKCYENYALYKNKYYRECFSYYDLGIIKKREESIREGHRKENCLSYKMRKFQGGTYD